jgi:hypothetical protein
MALNLLREEEQITVKDSDLLDGGDPDTTYTLRKLTPSAQRRIVKANTKRGNYKNAESVDWHAVRDEQVDHILIAWSGVMDPRTGKAAECTRANKIDGLDEVRKSALVDKAGLADVQAVEEARTASFRPAP